MRTLPAAMLPLLLAGCGTVPMPGYDRLDPGSWQLSATLGAPGTTKTAGPPQVAKLCLAAAEVARPVRETILGMASRGQCRNGGATFANGTIGGAIRCEGMDDIPAHPEAVSGSYSHDSFRITIDMPVYGSTVRQTIEAKRIGDCRG